MKKWLLAGCSLLLAGSLDAAQVRFLNGEVQEGKLDLGPRGITITKLSVPAAAVDLSSVLEIAFRPHQGAGDLLPAGVLLANGTAIADRNPPSLEEATVTVGLEKIPVPVTAIAWLLFNPLAPAKLEAAPAGQAGGLLEGGDFFPGTLVSLKGGRVSLNSLLFGPQSFTPKVQIVALCLRDLKTAPARFIVTTVQGSRFLTDDVRFEAAAVTVKDSLLGMVRLKSDDLESLRAGPGRFLALAEQKPFKVETRPGVDAAAAVQVQKNEGAEPAVITTAANLAITYTVPPGFTTFLSGVAVPKNANPNYRVAFAVYGDGHLLFHTPLYSVTDKPPPLRLDLRGAKVVTLRVEPFGAAAGSGEWTAPMILR